MVFGDQRVEVSVRTLKNLLNATEADLNDHWTLYQGHPDLDARIRAINEARSILHQKLFQPPF